MKSSLLCLLALLFALPAVAERKHSVGEYDVHYIAFNSGFLQPDIAAAAGLVRSKTQGVLNISVLKSGKPTALSQATSFLHREYEPHLLCVYHPSPRAWLCLSSHVRCIP